MAHGRLTAATFPILPANEIVETCRSLNPPCEISEEDLNKPTAPRVQAIYEWWMARVLGLNTEDCLRAANNEMDHMEHSEIYRDAMYVGVFQEALLQLLDMAAIDDFTTKDLTAPTSIRFRQHLSGLINFYLFEQEQAAETLDPVIAEEEDLLNKEEALLARSAELQQLIAQSKAQRAENAPKVAVAKAAIEQAKMDINAIRLKCDALEKQGQSYKAELKKIHADTVDISQTNRNQGIEIARLKSQIVQSPDKLRGSIEQLGLDLSREQENLRLLEAKERQMSGKIASLTKYESDLGACIKIMDEWEAEVGRAKEAAARLQLQTELLDSLRAEQADFEQRIALLSRKLQNSKDEIARFKQKTDEKRTLKRQAKASLEANHASLLEQKRTLENQAAQKNKEAADIEASIRQVLADTHAELDKGKAAYAKIRDQILMYSLKLNKALDLVNEVGTEPIDFA